MEFDASEQMPHYAFNKKGMTELEGIFERVRGPWYEGALAKAAYLFVAINKGHLFLNGNKRLSFIVMMDFLYRNDFRQKTIGHGVLVRWFHKEFPEYVIFVVPVGTNNTAPSKKLPPVAPIPVTE